MLVERQKNFTSFPDKFDKFIQWLSEEIRKTGVEREKVSIDIETICGWGDEVSSALTINYQTEETENEKNIRLQRETDQIKYKKLQYERLKKEFEGI